MQISHQTPKISNNFIEIKCWQQPLLKLGNRELFTIIFSNIVLKRRNKLLADWYWGSWLFVQESIDYSPCSVISASSSGGFTPRVDKIKKTVNDCMCLLLKWNGFHMECCRGAYHLHWKPGNSGWKMKWFIPFHLKQIRNYRLPV